MTTIAYKDGVLACDSQSVAGGIRIATSHKKVRKTANGWLVGAAGDAALVMRIMTWAESAFDMEKLPEITRGDGGAEAVALIINDKGEAFTLDYHGVVYPCDTPVAIGSGWELAMGAMGAGASAVEAVEVAKRYDINTGGDVQSVRLDAEKVVYPPFGYGIGASSS